MADSSSKVDILSLSNPVFRVYLISVCVLVIKVLLSILLIARHRFSKRIFISPEDTIFKDSTVSNSDPDIERCRRAHLNDLENIPFFFVAAFAFMWTQPSLWLAQALFLIYTTSRIVYTVVYAVVVMPQPTRVIVFSVGYAIVIYMAAYSGHYAYSYAV